MADTQEADEIARIITLLYGTLNDGNPFWCYVAVKPSMQDAFTLAHTGGTLDLENFDDYGEIVVSGEGEKPTPEITAQVANMYQVDPAAFFKPTDIPAAVESLVEKTKE